MLLIKRNFFTPINYCWINCSNQIKSKVLFKVGTFTNSTNIIWTVECIRYSTIETKESARIGYNGFLFRTSTQVKAEVRSTKAVTRVRMRKKKPVISNTGKFFCFNNNVYNLYNNSVVDKINGIAYIFTLLMFRKPNKATINKNKTTNYYQSTSFRFSFIFRYFKVFQVKRIVYI
jgi:hypothetical protein